MNSDAGMTSPLRERVRALVEHERTQRLVLWLILVNAVILGLETSATVRAHPIAPWLVLLDQLMLCIFVLEIAARLYAHRAAFFRDPWSVFDFVVVAIALVPATGQFSVLRALRVLRVLRLLTIVPSLRRVVGGLLAAIPGLSSIALVLMIIFYVAGVIATNLFGEAFPEWFGTLGRSLYTLFQVMTLESWSMGIARPVMEVYPYAWAFFIPYIMIATFTMLNLFIGIIVSAMQGVEAQKEAEMVSAVQQARDTLEHDLHEELKRLRCELAEIKATLHARHPPQDSA